MTTTKKLSEIGRPVSSNYTPNPSEEYWAYTAKERRELVKQAIYKFMTGPTDTYDLEELLGECVRKFLEEQGI